MNGHHATFGSFNTPISPGEALSRFSPLRHYGISPLRPAKRTTSSRWRYEDKNWWVEEGKATVFTRSVSASAIAPTVASQQTCNTGCFAHERLANLRNRISDDQYLERPGGYSAEQLAGYNLYNMKSKRLSSHEYRVNGPSMPLPVSPVSPQTPTRVDLPPRIVELEGSPPMASPSTFQNPPISTAMYADYPASHTTSPTKHANAITIARKPVGSGISPKMSRTSDPLLIWTLESSKTPRIAQTRSPREIKHQYVRSYDESATPYNRQEYAGQTQWEMDATRTSSQGTSASPTTIRHTNTRLRPSVRFRGDTLQELQPAIAEVESPYLSQYLQKRSTPPTRSPPLQHHRHYSRTRNPSLNIPAVADTLGFTTPTLNLNFAAAYFISDFDSVRDWFFYLLKLFFILYLAACVWNILAAVRDGVVRALEPVIAVCALVRWVLGAGR